MRTTQTVRRNTKRYRQILETARDCRVYSLSNHFCGKDCNPLALVEYMAPEGRFASLKSRLSTDGETYTLHVHGNLWFEFRAQA